jgi:hypothetical protein
MKRVGRNDGKILWGIGGCCYHNYVQLCGTALYIRIYLFDEDRGGYCTGENDVCNWRKLCRRIIDV